MPRVHHVKKARKDNPAVKAGEPYYWWKFRFGPKCYSATPPKRWQLTRSEFLSEVWQIEDHLPFEMTEDDVQDLVGQLEGLRDTCQDNLDNMPDSLQQSPTGELLQERVDNLEQWIDDIGSIDLDSLTPEEIAEAVSSSNPGW